MDPGARCRRALKHLSASVVPNFRASCWARLSCPTSSSGAVSWPTRLPGSSMIPCIKSALCNPARRTTCAVHPLEFDGLSCYFCLTIISCNMRVTRLSVFLTEHHFLHACASYVCRFCSQDPVTEQHTRRVMKFLASTNWKNEAALKCQLAVMVLALRGRNVERVFWTQGPGGVGQSLNTDTRLWI